MLRLSLPQKTQICWALKYVIDVFFFCVFSGTVLTSIMQYIAAFSACSLAEYFRSRGKDAVVIFDSLSAHAEAFTSIARYTNIMWHKAYGQVSSEFLF